MKALRAMLLTIEREGTLVIPAPPPSPSRPPVVLPVRRPSTAEVEQAHLSALKSQLEDIVVRVQAIPVKAAQRRLTFTVLVEPVCSAVLPPPWALLREEAVSRAKALACITFSDGIPPRPFGLSPSQEVAPVRLEDLPPPGPAPSGLAGRFSSQEHVAAFLSGEEGLLSQASDVPFVCPRAAGNPWSFQCAASFGCPTARLLFPGMDSPVVPRSLAAAASPSFHIQLITHLPFPYLAGIEEFGFPLEHSQEVDSP